MVRWSGRSWGDQLPSGIAAADWITHHARYTPLAEAAHDLASRRRFTYAQLDERVRRAALWLGAAFRIARGDRVAVLSRNDTDVFELQFACRRLGAVFVPLNWRLAVPELDFICRDAAPNVLLYGAEFGDTARELLARGRSGRGQFGQRPAERLRKWPGRSTRRPQRCAARFGRHLDHHVHVGHFGTAEGRADHLPDVRLQCAALRHAGRPDRALEKPGGSAHLPHWRHSTSTPTRPFTVAAPTW